MRKWRNFAWFWLENVWWSVTRWSVGWGLPWVWRIHWLGAMLWCPVLCARSQNWCVFICRQTLQITDATHGHLGVVGAGQLGGLAVCDGAVLAQHGWAGGGGGPHSAGRPHTRQHFRYSYSYSFVKHETQIQYSSVQFPFQFQFHFKYRICFYQTFSLKIWVKLK